MAITHASIQDFRQFRNLALDFTDPVSGKPLEKICFIGPNGTGKSTLLKALAFAYHAPYTIFGGVVPAVLKRNSDFERSYYCNAESENLPTHQMITGVSLHTALTQDFQQNVVAIGQDQLVQFWSLLLRRIKERESAYIRAMEASDPGATVAEIRDKFDASHPKVLEKLALLWDRILAPIGLEFDLEGASIPVMPMDNFQAYIRLKHSKEQLEWGELSTGIRHFLFRLGHLYTETFANPNKEIGVFVDEPEASLHPAFLYDLVELYREVAPGAQLFMATHSEIIASQFRPEERFRLVMDADGSVRALPGVSPEGDDPNDLLRQDFGVGSLYGAKGLEMWERYRELGRSMKQETDPAKRELLAEKYMEIGSAYNFPSFKAGGAA
jgi:adenylate kinase family enzyme